MLNTLKPSLKERGGEDFAGGEEYRSGTILKKSTALKGGRATRVVESIGIHVKVDQRQ